MSSSHYKLTILVILVVLGFVLQQAGLIELSALISVAREYSDRWWLWFVLIAIQIALFTFAMPGSSLVWITAALFTPATSTLIFAAGTTLGGISAYLFSQRLSEEWSRTVRHSPVYKLLREQGNFMTLFAVRVMPGFPHSVINYSSGILHLKLINFIPATLLGITIKAYVYSELIYKATTATFIAEDLAISDVWPLFVLSLVLLVIMLIRHYRDNQ